MRRRSNTWLARMGMTVAMLVAIFAGGCMHHPGGVAPSTKPIAPGSYTVLGKVRGQDCVYYLLGIIPVTGGNETRSAVADALDKRRLPTHSSRSPWTDIFSTSSSFRAPVRKCTVRQCRRSNHHCSSVRKIRRGQLVD